MFWDFIDVFSKIRSKQKFYADDNFDKLNRSFTVILILVSTLVVCARTLIGKAIVCLHDTQQQEDKNIGFIEETCWAKGTYQLPKELLPEDTDEKKVYITYYQWIPFILLFMAFTFYLPYLLWKLWFRSTRLTDNIPVDISSVIETLKSAKMHKSSDFNAAIKQAAEYLHHCFINNSPEYKYAIRSGFIDYDFDAGKINLIKYNKMSEGDDQFDPECCCLKKRTRCCFLFPCSMVFLKYMVVKIYYIFNVLFVLWFLNTILQFDKALHMYGADLVYYVFYSQNPAVAEKLWHSKYFPRHVRCTISLQATFWHVNPKIFQCVLPSNIFTEKVFVLLWFWICILLVLNVLGLFTWLYRGIKYKSIIRRYLNVNVYLNNNALRQNGQNNERLFKLFINNYLQFDGVFMFLLVRSNLNDLYVRRLLESLWKQFSISNLDDDEIMTPQHSQHPPKISPLQQQTSQPGKVPTSVGLNKNSRTPVTYAKQQHDFDGKLLMDYEPGSQV